MTERLYPLCNGHAINRVCLSRSCRHLALSRHPHFGQVRLVSFMHAAKSEMGGDCWPALSVKASAYQCLIGPQARWRLARAPRVRLTLLVLFISCTRRSICMCQSTYIYMVGVLSAVAVSPNPELLRLCTCQIGFLRMYPLFVAADGLGTCIRRLLHTNS